jgi:hypothetical protein
MNFENAFVHELHNDFVSGIGIDLQRFAEFAHGGEGVTGAHLAGDYGLFGGVDDLLVE